MLFRQAQARGNWPGCRIQRAGLGTWRSGTGGAGVSRSRLGRRDETGFPLKILAQISAALLAFGVIECRAAREIRVPLLIDFSAGPAGSWPAACGVPFAAGTMPDAGALGVVDDAGVAVPAQSDVTATWLDGSARWAMLHFIATPGRKYFAVAGQDSSVRADAADGITVAESAAGMTVKTGGAEYFIAAEDAWIKWADYAGRPLLRDSGRGVCSVIGRADGWLAGARAKRNVYRFTASAARIDGGVAQGRLVCH